VTFSDDLRAATAKTWDAAVGHRFVAQMWAGRLDPDVLADYLVQESRLLLASSALLSARPELDRRPASVSRSELNYLDRAMDALDVPLAERAAPVLDEPVRELHALLESTGRGADHTSCVTLLLVADWLQLDWADRPDADPPTEPLQREWIEIHRGTPFSSWVDFLRRELDRAAAGLDEEGRDRIGVLFARTAELELAFFDSVHS
jgi:thiaminase (transcriptional activator TenA)